MVTRHSKTALYTLVGDLHAVGYRATDIGLALHRSPERIRQILRDIGLSQPRLRSVDDLPQFLRVRVVAFIAEDTTTTETVANATT